MPVAETGFCIRAQIIGTETANGVLMDVQSERHELEAFQLYSTSRVTRHCPGCLLKFFSSYLFLAHEIMDAEG